MGVLVPSAAYVQCVVSASLLLLLLRLFYLTEKESWKVTREEGSKG